MATQLGVRTTAACRLFPLGGRLSSTTSAGRCLPQVLGLKVLKTSLVTWNGPTSHVTE